MPYTGVCTCLVQLLETSQVLKHFLLVLGVQKKYVLRGILSISLPAAAVTLGALDDNDEHGEKEEGEVAVDPLNGPPKESNAGMMAKQRKILVRQISMLG